MELGCALREELISFFDDETLSQTKSESPRPNRLLRYDPYQILFSQEDGWDLQEKALKETRRELEEEEEKMHVQLLHNKGLGRESLGGYSLRTSSPSSSYI